jgi:hypothetical protein
VDRTQLGPGQLFHIYGHGFLGLPKGTEGWFYSDKNQFTALGRIKVHSDTDIAAIVPSHHLVDGPGKVSLFYTECVDCTAHGGGPNSCASSWVNGRTHIPDVEFVLPGSQPLPVSDLTAVAVSDTEIRLSWRDNSNNEDGFELYQGSSPAMTTDLLAKLAAGQTSEIITGLSPRTDYCFEVRAYNTSGWVPVYSMSKACATTLEPSLDVGSIDVDNVPGFDNTLCAGSHSFVLLHAFEDTNNDGIVNALGNDALNMPAPANMVIDIWNTPVWKIRIANRYAPGANLLLFGNFSGCGPGFPSFVALHMFRDRNDVITPLLFTAGNYEERTGPMSEFTGVVMAAGDLARPIIVDPSTGRLIGDVDAFPSFHLELPDQNLSFDAAAHVFFDFNRGVEVTRE